MTNKAETVPKRAQIDWEAVEMQYRAGIRSLKEIGKEFGVSDAGIIKRSKRDGWVRTPRAGKQKPVALEPDAFGVAGFVYVIYLQDSAEKRYYKIGMASSFTPRFAGHQCSSPFKIIVACAYFVGNMRSEEKDLHRVFANKRIRGEWFNLTTDDLRYIAKRALLQEDES